MPDFKHYCIPMTGLEGMAGRYARVTDDEQGLEFVEVQGGGGFAPLFYAYANTSQMGATGDETQVRVELDTAPMNVGGCFDTEEHEFIVPVTGWYWMFGSVFLHGLTADNEYAAASYLNETLQARVLLQPNPYINPWAQSYQASTMLAYTLPMTFQHLLEGDHIFMNVVVGGSETKNVNLIGAPDLGDQSYSYWAAGLLQADA